MDIALSAHKISLLVQSELGAVDLPDGEAFQKHRFTFQQDKTFVFSHINRLIRCIIDCQVGLEDSFTLRNALELARSFGAKVWDDSPLQMKQIEQIGVVAVRKLASSGITSIEALELCEPHQIDMILSRNPPFGRKLLERLVDFPKLRVSVKMIGKVLYQKPLRSLADTVAGNKDWYRCTGQYKKRGRLHEREMSDILPTSPRVCLLHGGYFRWSFARLPTHKASIIDDIPSTLQRL